MFVYNKYGTLHFLVLQYLNVLDSVCRPKWPSSSFVSADVLITAMAYRTPHVVLPFIFLVYHYAN